MTSALRFSLRRSAAASLGAAALAITQPAAAQTLPGDTLRPVDQAVEDLDLRATSQRRIDPGNALFSSRTEMYRLDPGVARVWTPQLPQLSAKNYPYLYHDRGVQVLSARPQYLVFPRTALERSLAVNQAPHEDGAFLEMTPPGAVFNLIPQTAATGLVDRPLEPSMPRVGRRVETRIDGRLVPTGLVDPEFREDTDATATAPSATLDLMPPPARVRRGASGYDLSLMPEDDAYAVEDDEAEPAPQTARTDR